MLYVNFISKVKEILDPLAGPEEEKPLSAVYIQTPKDEIKFPCVTLDYEGPDSVEREDSDNNMQNLTITARLLFPDKDGEEAYLLRLEVLQTVLDQFNTRANVDTIDGVIEIWEITDIVPFDTDTPERMTGREITITGRNSQVLL